jgi:hypothetical protein
MGFLHWDQEPISVINKIPQSHYSYSYFALHFKNHLWYHLLSDYLLNDGIPLLIVILLLM